MQARVLLTCHSYMKQENKIKFCFPVVGVGFDLSSRTVASQVLLALQSLTSVFGMGTGGPSALKVLTRSSKNQIRTHLFS